MTVFPNVKLNLGLRVLGVREDGYHDIETVFIPYYGFCDTLEIVPSHSFEINISGPEYTGWDPAGDLTARAWRLLRSDFNINPVHIELEKTSPVGAGLGGGSADGAFALMIISDLFSLGLRPGKLAEYAAMLGSDCPFFIYNTPVFATGRGEIFEPVQLPLDGFRFEARVPEGVHVGTKEAYAGLGKAGSSTDLKTALRGPVSSWRGSVVNDFEASVFPAHPEIAALKEKMYADGAVFAAMSGSGSAVFGIFEK